MHDWRDPLLSRHFLVCLAIGNLYEWMEQASNGCELGERPIVVCRADRKEWLAVLPIEELFRLIREEVSATGGK